MRDTLAYLLRAVWQFRLVLQRSPVVPGKRLLAPLIFVWLWCSPLFATGPTVLIVVAHPDDESCFSATSYRITKELGGRVDEVVMTNGEGGFRYSTLAEVYYDLDLSQQGRGRVRLPEIRKQELLKAGRILGIREFYFFGQPDQGFTQDIQEALAGWDQESVSQRLNQILTTTHYDFVFTLFPTNETHGHHKLATMFALQSVASLQGEKPVVLGCQNASAQTTETLKWTVATGLPPVTLVNSIAFVFDRSRKFGFHDALDYQIIANWEIAEHKSQGLLQTDVNRFNREEFVIFDVSGQGSLGRTSRLFEQLAPMSLMASSPGK
jgi:LmbE family N-acetylglucosaminyl deacetylase